MKRLLKKSLAFFMSIILMLSLLIAGATSASAANYYGDYTTITNVPTRSNCYAMEAFAVGSTYLYTAKADLSTNNCVVISKTNKNTGKITNLSTNSGATTFNYLGHANAMDVVTVNGKSNLYISTMSATTNNLVRMEVDGSKINKKGAFTIRKDGQPISMPCMAITANTSTKIEFLFSRGYTFYKGSIDKNATSGYIDVSYAFKVNTKEVTINGATKDLSAFCWQDFGYHNGKIFVALSGHTAGKPNQSAVVVYDVENASGTIKSVSNLSFFINSTAYPEKCEIEGCDISPSDGKLYFNTNRIKNGDGRNYDGIHVFKNYTYNESVFPQTVIGNVDSISGGIGSVTVRGWAFDKNATSSSTSVHVYIGGPAGSGEGHAITANTSRTDVNGVYGCGNNHGFDATISTSLRGSQPIYLYAINARKGTNRLIGSGTVNITSDTSAPSIGNVRVTELSENGYRVTCDIWDNTGVTSVKFPTWTSNNGQDDLIWHEGSISGNTATFYISRNDHKGEYGTYYTHIYAYDAYGNQTCNADTNVNVIGANITYSGHVQNIGDVAPVSNWATLGTVGQSLRIEGVKMYISGMSGDVQYRVHVQNYGWMDWKSANAYAGTTGKGLRIEAIQIKLTGDVANYYNVEYQAHVQNYGWMAVCSNGATAGTTGQSLRVEGLRVRLVRK